MTNGEQGRCPLPQRVQGRTERMSLDMVDGVAMRWFSLTPGPRSHLTAGAGEPPIGSDRHCSRGRQQRPSPALRERGRG